MFASSMIGGSGVAVGGGIVAVWVGNNVGSNVGLGGSGVGVVLLVTTHANTPKLNARIANRER